MGEDDRQLSELAEPRRVNYYYGQLLTADDFRKEQEYHRRRERLLNRAVCGYGVVSGLGVEADGREKPALRVEPGIALDAWGRTIVVPAEQVLGDLPERGVVVLCYREEARDEGTTAESYEVRVQEGRAESVEHRCLDQAREALRAGRLHQAACALAAARAAGLPDDPCIVLVTVSTAPDGRLEVDACAPRFLVAANDLLLALVACLAERLEERPPPRRPRKRPRWWPLR